MGEIKRVFNQTFFQLIGKSVSAVTTLFSLFLITNHFGEAGTGLYTLALTYLAFFNIAADLGINAYMLPYFQKDHSIWKSILGLRIILGIGLTIIALLGMFFVAHQDETFYLAIVLGSFSILGSAIFTTCNLVFQEKFRYDLSVIAASISSIISLGIVWLLVSGDYSISTLTIASSVGWIVCVGLGVFFVQKFVQLGVLFRFHFVKNTFLTIWPISATLLLNVIYFRIDVFLLNYFRSLSEVGIYNFAYQFFQTALVLPTFIMNGLYPLLLAKKEQSPLMIKQFIWKASLIMLGLGLLGAIFTWIVSPVVIQLIAKNGGFSGSILALQILGLSFPAFFVSAVLMWSMVTFQLNRKMFSIYFIGLIFNFVLNLLVIPEYSYIGAAWVTVFCEYLILSMQLVILLRTLKA